MSSLPERFLVDEQGKGGGEVLDLAAYQKIREALRAYEAAKQSREERIPFAQAVAEIERKKKRKRVIPSSSSIILRQACLQVMGKRAGSNFDRRA
jgi:hypothetical protein